MRRRFNLWTVVEFLAVATLGTLGHFAYAWSGNHVLAGAVCAVNESTWEHMKLLFFPLMLVMALRLCVRPRAEGVPAVWAVSVTVGLLLIPVLFYTYSGAWGRMAGWANILIFYLAAGGTFGVERRLRYRLRRPWQQTLGVLWLWGLAFLFVWWTFEPPQIALFRDPLTGLYGI